MCTKSRENTEEGTGRAGVEDGQMNLVRGRPRVLRLDLASRVLSCEGARHRLTPSEASVLIVLLRAAPNVVETAAMWEALRGGVPARQTSALRALMHQLRSACIRVFGYDPVQTVRGRGYRLRPGTRLTCF